MKYSLLILFFVGTFYVVSRGATKSIPETSKHDPMVLIGACTLSTSDADCAEYSYNTETLRVTGLSAKDYERMAMEQCGSGTLRKAERCSSERVVGYCDSKETVLETTVFSSRRYSYVAADAGVGQRERAREEKRTGCQNTHTWVDQQG